MTPETDAQIAAAWPDKWARAKSSSKRRNNLRKAWAGRVALQAFKTANPYATCATCDHCRPCNYSFNLICDLDSNYYGDQITDAKNVCVRWKAKIND